MSNDIAKLEIISGQGLTEKQRVIRVLNTLLADESVLYTKLRNYCWNVAGMNMYALQSAFENQFLEIAIISDVIATHIRQYGADVIGTMHEFLRKSHLFEEPSVYPNRQRMLVNIVTDHETIIRFLHKDILTFSNESEDVDTLDLLTGFIHQHEKMAAVMRSYMEPQATVSADHL